MDSPSFSKSIETSDKRKQKIIAKVIKKKSKHKRKRNKEGIQYQNSKHGN
jgi:hypothetical protein